MKVLWPNGRSVSSCAMHAGLWLEDASTGQPASLLRVAAAQMLDMGYGVATLGIGVVISLGLRCCDARHASVWERILSLRLVQETSEEL